MLPPFTAEGLLPAGDYPLTLDDLRGSMLVSGPPDLVAARQWDQQWRTQLVENLAVLVQQLWQVGVERIFIDGSFVEDKPRPGDIDGYFECTLQALVSGTLARDLNTLAGMPVWDWTARVPDPNSTKQQLLMWERYRVELYPRVSSESSDQRRVSRCR